MNAYIIGNTTSLLDGSIELSSHNLRPGGNDRKTTQRMERLLISLTWCNTHFVLSIILYSAFESATLFAPDQVYAINFPPFEGGPSDYSETPLWREHRKLVEIHFKDLTCVLCCSATSNKRQRRIQNSDSQFESWKIWKDEHLAIFELVITSTSAARRRKNKSENSAQTDRTPADPMSRTFREKVRKIGTDFMHR